MSTLEVQKIWGQKYTLLGLPVKYRFILMVPRKKQSPKCQSSFRRKAGVPNTSSVGKPQFDEFKKTHTKKKNT